MSDAAIESQPEEHRDVKHPVTDGEEGGRATRPARLP